MPSAVVNGQLRHVSPSQIVTFMRCRRKWYYEKVLHVEVPSTGAQLEGTNVHRQLEDYYKSGTQPTHPSALAALAILPARDRALLIESSTSGLSYGGVDCHGRLDLLDWTSQSCPTIIDYKVRSKFDWNKTSEELAADVQMQTYGDWATRKWPNANECRLVHVYLLSSKAGVESVSATVTRAHLEAFHQQMDAVVGEMVATARNRDLESVVRSWDVDGDASAACRDWGGCPFVAQCGKSVEERFFMRFGPDEDPTVQPPTLEVESQ